MSSVSDLPSDIFPTLVPSVQIGFYKRLMDAQSEYLLPALLSLVAPLI